MLPEGVQYDVPSSIGVPKVENSMRTNTELPHIVHLLREALLGEAFGAIFHKPFHDCSDFGGFCFLAGSEDHIHVFMVWTRAVGSGM